MEQVFDFYVSPTGIDLNDECRDRMDENRPTIKKFKGRRFSFAVPTGTGKPATDLDDLVLIGTGTYDDVTILR